MRFVCRDGYKEAEKAALDPLQPPSTMPLVRAPRAKLVLTAAFAAMSQHAGVLAAAGSHKPAFMGSPPLFLGGNKQMRLAPHRTMRSSSAACSASASATTSAVGEVAEPVARQEPVRSEYHGFVRDDPFHWMKDDNWQQVRLFHAL